MRQIVQILCVIAVASFAVAQSVTTTGNSGPLTTGSMQATSDVMAVFSHWQKGVLTADELGRKLTEIEAREASES